MASKRRKDEPSSSNKEAQKFGECPTCREEKLLDLTPCRHYICKSCLKEWLAQHWLVRAPCPICRRYYSMPFGKVVNADCAMQ